jgi:hypothetical protein
MAAGKLNRERVGTRLNPSFPKRESFLPASDFSFDTRLPLGSRLECNFDL